VNKAQDRKPSRVGACLSLSLSLPGDLLHRSESITRSRGVGYLAYLSAFLLVVLYLGRLIILDPSNAVILIPALLNGFVISPALYLLLGFALLSGRGDHHS
jgi:hypothetical protein